MKSRNQQTTERIMMVILLMFFISIIVFLANEWKQRARDVKRFNDIRAIEKALYMYYGQHGHYPKLKASTLLSSNWLEISPDYNWPDGATTTLMEELKEYLDPLPHDPAGYGNTDYMYFYDSDAGDGYQSFGLACRLESKSNFILALTDMGIYNNDGEFYELGSQPNYCRHKYGSSWFDPGSKNNESVCIGGD
jgi:hypothetical protein